METMKNSAKDKGIFDSVKINPRGLLKA